MAESSHKFAAQYDLIRQIPLALRNKASGLNIQVERARTEDDLPKLIVSGTANNLQVKLDIEAAVRGLCPAGHTFVSRLRAK